MRFLSSAGVTRTGRRAGTIFISMLAGLAGMLMTGCGTPGAPQPPSLRLPEPVQDLTAERAGEGLTLHWTSAKKTTDHLLIVGSIQAEVCRREALGSCQAAGEVTVVPGAEATFHETLPAALVKGKPRLVSYFVELKSPKGHSAGLSNAAAVVAGTAPGAITGLSAEVRADGVALHWAGADEPEADTIVVRLHRRLLTAATPKEKKETGLMSTPVEPELRDLLVETPPDRQGSERLNGALDRTARFGESYEYSAQRVERILMEVATGKKILELAGELSAPVRVAVIDRFPPDVPQGLAAVSVPEEKTIDLSWQPDTDADLAGYIVYRIGSGEAANGNGEADWIRISGPRPVVGPAYRDKTVQAGSSYRYKVSAIDLTGHESAGSAEAQEMVPNP
jgi:hypothetical protein